MNPDERQRDWIATITITAITAPITIAARTLCALPRLKGIVAA